MKRSDKYPAGTVEDARNLPPMVRVLGLHPLVWGLITVFMLAGIGAYAEMVGFYELDDLHEILSDDESDDEESDDEESDSEDTPDGESDPKDEED